MVTAIRAIEPWEFDDMRRAMGLVFGSDPPQGDSRFERVLPFDRTRCVFDNGQIVATSGAFSLTMTVPGAQVPCGGTTAVAVLPTHRRRGLLRQMMRAHLDDVREHGEPIAALWASDSAIYGRFGYGCASICHDIEIEAGQVRWNRLAPDPGPARLVNRAEAFDLAPPLYDRLRAVVPGFFGRTTEWWEDRSLRDSESHREGGTALRYVVVDGQDGIDGFATYRTRPKWDQHGAGRVVLRDLFAVTPEAWSGLWSLVLNQDLIRTTEGGLRPTWDPVFDLVAGTRRVRATRLDALWVRLMDVPLALEARSYSSSIDVVIAVSDPIGDVSGSYRLHAGSEGAECTPTTEGPSVWLDLEDLSSGYMGHARFRELARAGRVTGDPSSITALDAAFSWDPRAWCPEIF
ncbi:MAG TPA: GNAT family N-acetyltransferase [Acidimicrobiia bacterium]|nr:GNAT family N-acetyltransferase [Acidimicrobiia bacterium]